MPFIPPSPCSSLPLLHLFTVVVFLSDFLFPSSFSTAEAKTLSVNPDGTTEIDTSVCPNYRTRKEILRNTTTDYKTILAQSSSYCSVNQSRKQFASDTLAYITPWNNHGYDVAKFGNGKFDILSPVWLQLRMNATTRRPMITGTHDIDKNWMQELRKKTCSVSSSVEPHTDRTGSVITKCPAIVPRIAWELNVNPTATLIPLIVTVIVDIIKEYSFDGIVMEGSVTEPYFPVIKAVTKGIHGTPRSPSSRTSYDTLLYIQVIPPGALTSKQFVTLSSTDYGIDRFSLMTYDYSVHRGNGNGPNAPLSWVRSSVEALLNGITDTHQRKLYAKRILTGLAFYGYDNGEAITYGRYTELLRNRKPIIRWEKDFEEHSFTYMDTDTSTNKRIKRVVHYPTLQSITCRLELADELGTGISIWEIGQGLDYFIDLL